MRDSAASEGRDRGRAVTVDFDALLERYHKKIFNVLLRMVGDFHEAADLTQDVFLQAYRALPSFRGESKVYTWLYRIAVNRGKNKMKQRDRGGAVVGASLDDPLDPEDGLTREVPDYSLVPDRMLQRAELQAVVSQEIASLVPDFRLVIILRDIEGLSYRDMAEVVGISLEAVKSRLFRARTQLRKQLLPYLQDHDDGADRSVE
ncbi:MAG: sigma-70 family RNA polymerase sigma factor [Fimbriimonadaceae bacterium]|nr:sigma-70 family RNA polymerase sigma factor [Fimbriimonadaceae bacterium]